MPHPPAVRFHRHGLSLVELLVVIGLIGLLAALLLPAVQMAREASRRSMCANNLAQLGRAVHSYESAYAVLPPGTGHKMFSLHVAILPYTEQIPLFNSINVTSNSIYASGANLTAGHTIVGTFLCPSDSPGEKPSGCTNYVGNRGSGVQKYGYNGVFVVPGMPPVRLADVADGSATTALLSEWLFASGEESEARDPRRAVFQTSPQLTAPDELDRFAALCRELDPKTAPLNHPAKGRNWMFGDFGFTLYNHTLSPNNKTCTNGSAFQQGAWSVGSHHSGGVQVLFVDGHIQFVRDGVREGVWRAIGSRHGGEVISSDEY